MVCLLSICLLFLLLGFCGKTGWGFILANWQFLRPAHVSICQSVCEHSHPRSKDSFLCLAETGLSILRASCWGNGWRSSVIEKWQFSTMISCHIFCTWSHWVIFSQRLELEFYWIMHYSACYLMLPRLCLCCSLCKKKMSFLIHSFAQKIYIT